MRKEVSRWEEEHGLLLQQNGRLVVELESLRTECHHLRSQGEKNGYMLKDKEEEVERLTKALEVAEPWEEECVELRRRVEAHRRKEEEMRLHINKLDRYLLNMAADLDEARDSRVKAEKEVKIVREERENLRLRLQEVGNEVKGVSKPLHHANQSRQSFGHAVETLQSVLENFMAGIRDSSPPLDMCRMVGQGQHELLLSSSSSSATTAAKTSPNRSKHQHHHHPSRPASSPSSHQRGNHDNAHQSLADLASQVRTLYAEMASVSPRVVDEVVGVKRESKFLKNDLDEIASCIKGVVKKVDECVVVPVVGVALSLSQKIHDFDTNTDMMVEELRGLTRARISNVQAMLKEAHEEQADLVIENERLKHEAQSLQAMLTDTTELSSRLEEVRLVMMMMMMMMIMMPP